MAFKHFEVSSEDGKTTLKLRVDTLGKDVCWSKSVLEELHVISKKDNLKILDLHLPDVKEEILGDVSCLVAEIVLQKTCKRVIVSDIHLIKIRGKVQGLIFQDVKKALGDSVAIAIGRSTLLTKDIISVAKFTDKIVSKTIDPECLGIISKLNSLDMHSNVPVLTVAVTKAFKKLRKSRLSLRVKSSICDQVKGEVKSVERVCVKDNSMKEGQGTVETHSVKSNTDKDFSNVDVDGASACSSKVTEKVKDKSLNIKRYCQKLSKDKKCYVCKIKYKFPMKAKIADYWQQYPRMCQPCAEVNFQKRHLSTDLTGKYAIVTGGRIKIGYELVLKLLRDGCFVIVTTRFPHNASKSFAEEKDFEDWKDRLQIYGLDLKDIAGINKFVKYVQRTVPYLDILINNAAQTLRRPLDFYRHLLDYECIPQNHLREKQQPLLATSQALNYNYYSQLQQGAVQASRSTNTKPLVEDITEDVGDRSNNECPEMEAQSPKVEIPADEVPMYCGQDNDEPPVKKMKSAPLLKKPEKSKILFLQRSFSADCQSTLNSHLSKEQCVTQVQTSIGHDRSMVRQTNHKAMFNMGQYFPRGALDDDGQQLDLRRTNSWRTVLDHVPVPELMEVMVVNAIAPFILNRDLKPLFMKSPSARKFIVNVSAMEGQFNRAGKTKFHPHTNMAKAALNMMTRTAALGYKKQGIFMTSVDTGWVTDERPVYMAMREKRQKGFRLPLDCVDGAARIYDPIVTGLSKEDVPHFAIFLKDYQSYPW